MSAMEEDVLVDYEYDTTDSLAVDVSLPDFDTYLGEAKAVAFPVEPLVYEKVQFNTGHRSEFQPIKEPDYDARTVSKRERSEPLASVPDKRLKTNGHKKSLSVGSMDIHQVEDGIAQSAIIDLTSTLCITVW